MELTRRQHGSDANECCWHACATYRRYEKRVYGTLIAGKFEAFLPVVATERQWTDRIRVREDPLFPGYVFVRFPRQELLRVLNVRGVVAVLGTGRTPVSNEEIDSIRVLSRSLASGAPRPERLLRKGQRVRITRGPLTNVVGTVTAQQTKARVIVGVQALGIGIAVDVDSSIIQPIDSAETFDS